MIHDDLETGKTCNTILTAGIPSCWYRDDVHDQTSHSDDILQREALMGSSVRDLTQSEILAVRSGSKVVYIVLLIAAMSLSLATYFFLSTAQRNQFESEFLSYAREAADIAEKNANNAFEQLMNLATVFTSRGLESLENSSGGGGFPNVTIPHFDIWAQSIVKFTGVEMVLFAPFVEYDLKPGWESFINNHMSNHDDAEPYSGTYAYAIEPCSTCSEIADTRNGFQDVDEYMDSILQQKVAIRHKTSGNIANISAPVVQYGPLPQGQRDSSVNKNTPLIMQDLLAHPIFRKEVTAALEYNVPVISEPLDVQFLLSHSRSYHDEKQLATTTTTTERDHDDDDNYDGHHSVRSGDVLRSFTLDAVKESFEDDAKTVGFVISILPWGAFFAKVLTVDRHHLQNAREINGVVVKVVSDCGGVFTYVMNGGKADVMFEGDRHDLYKEFENVHHMSRFFWKDHPKGLSRHCHFDLHIYPSRDFYSFYNTKTPIMYAGVIFAVFVFTATLFSFYDRYIFKRQRKVIMHATGLIIDNARRAAQNEREMNDFIAHEVRNPLAAAMSACSFVASTLKEEEVHARTALSSGNPVIPAGNGRATIMEDLEIIDSSLHFINDLLRNLLDMQRASSKQMTIEEKAIHVMDDVFHPVSNMLHIPKGSAITVELVCDASDANDMVVMADPLRLKQILLNLSRNAVKFVERGFIRLRARVVDKENPSGTGEVTKRIELSVEDSGPGIPTNKRNQLFGKFQETLDSLNQGTGIGLNLCLKLSTLMGADLYLDERYDSGIPGCPGARFVLDLQKPPIVLTTTILESSFNPSEYDSELIGIVQKSSKPIGISHCTDCTTSELLTDASMGSASMTEPALLPSHSEVSTLNATDELPRNLNVLFTDDDMVLRKLFSRSLKKVAPNWNIKEASNGETAIKLAQSVDPDSCPFDLIFMDQYMASVNKQLLGTETTRALRGLGVTSIICGLSANDVEQAFLDAGANVFMVKPFPCKPELLKAELVRILATTASRTNPFLCHHAIRSDG